MTDIEFFKENGYLFLQNFFSEEEMYTLEASLKEAKPRFPTTLNKSGLVFCEFVHFHSKALQSFIASEKMVNFLKDYIGDDFWLRKDQTVTKYPGGEEFPWHQDNAYNKLKDAYNQFWVALTDMSPENGGLRLLAGTHKSGILPHKLVDNHLAWQGDDKKEIIIRAKRGDVLFFSSMLLHRTGPNHTQNNRVAYVLEFMSSEHFDPYVHPPYFQVVRNGRSDPKFINFYKGNLSIKNQWDYLGPRIKRKSWLIETGLKDRLKKLRAKT